MAISGLASSMLAAQVVEYKKPYEIHQVPTPQSLGPHDLLLKTAVASLCHTDGMVQDGVFSTKLPCIASHEGTGTVVAIGEEVKHIKKGDRVMAGLPRNRCGHCQDCQGPENYRQYCPNIAGHVGVTLDGAFAEYMVVDARESCVIPDKVSFETAAPLACAGCTVYRGVLEASLKKGETIALVGAGGGLGHLGCQFAKAMGLVVVALDARDEGLKLAKDCKADIVIDVREGKDKVVEEVMKVTKNGADATVNISDARDAAALSCSITKMHGTVIQIAQPTNVSVPFQELVFRDVRVKGSLICSNQEAQAMLQMVADHNITVKTNPFMGLKEIPKLVELAHSGKWLEKG